MDCLAEGSKIVIDACEVFLLCMLRPPASSSSAASTVVSERFSTPSPLSACQSPYEEVPPVPAKLISILQVMNCSITAALSSALCIAYIITCAPAIIRACRTLTSPQAKVHEISSLIKQFSKSSIDMLVADVLQSCLDDHKPLDLWTRLGDKATHEMLLQCSGDANPHKARDMNEWEKLKRSCWRFAAIMRVLVVAVPSMNCLQQSGPGLWKPQLVVVREPKVKDVIVVGPEEEKELLACCIMKAQEPQRFRMWIRDNCILLCTPHPSELQRVCVKSCYGLNRLNEAGFANLPREHPDRDRCLLLTVRPSVQHLEAAAVGKHAAISTLVSDEMQRVEVVFESEDKAASALELLRKNHVFFKEKQKVSLEKVLLIACDLSE